MSAPRAAPTSEGRCAGNGSGGPERMRTKRTGRALVAVLLTLVGAGAFVELAYLPHLRRPLLDRLGVEHPFGSGRTQVAYTPRANLANEEARAVAERRSAEILARRDEVMSEAERVELVSLWQDLDIWQNMWFLGTRIQKNPCDLFMVQQILYEVQPDFVIECGTAYGGSALYWASLLDAMGLEDSRVLTIDIADRCQDAREHPFWKRYVEFVHSSSTEPATVARIQERVAGRKVVVMLDSWHADHHVLAELEAYAPLVNPGSYVIVEDTHMDLVGVVPEGAEAGPGRAVEVFLEERGGAELFEVDETREQMVLTFNPGGFLRRRSE